MYQRDGQIGSWWVPAMIVGAVAFAALTWGSAPGLLWYDTGEFGAVAWRLSLCIHQGILLTRCGPMQRSSCSRLATESFELTYRALLLSPLPWRVFIAC